MINIVRVYDKQVPGTHREYCGRTGKGQEGLLGNPFWMKDESHRDEVCNQFEEYFKDSMATSYKLHTRINELVEIAKIQDIELACFCQSPKDVVKKRCHTETIKAYIEQQLEESKMKTQVNEPIGIIRPVEVKPVKPELKEIPSMTYAGIGSRQCNDFTLFRISKIAPELESLGFKLYSGAAPGADKAFSNSCTNKVEFIPWKGFNNCFTGIVAVSNEAMELAATLHPAWDKLSQGAKKLMARNCHQILGEDLNSPVDFVLCWTPDGAETKTGYNTGGTGQAIRLANRYGIPVINMFNADWKQRLDVLLEDIHILNQTNQINLSTY